MLEVVSGEDNLQQRCCVHAALGYGKNAAAAADRPAAFVKK